MVQCHTTHHDYTGAGDNGYLFMRGYMTSYAHHMLELLVLTRLAPEQIGTTQHCHIHGTTSRHVNSVFSKHVLLKVSKCNPSDVIHVFYIHFKPLLSVEADLSMLSWGVFQKNLLLQVVPGDAEHDKLIDHFLTQRKRVSANLLPNHLQHRHNQQQ